MNEKKVDLNNLNQFFEYNKKMGIKEENQAPYIPKLSMLVDFFKAFKINPPHSIPKFNLEDFNERKMASQIYQEWRPTIIYSDIALRTGIDRKTEDLKEDANLDLLSVSLENYKKFYEYIAKYILKPAYKSLKKGKDPNAGFLFRYFKEEYENGKYKLIFDKIEPIIKNAISHHSYEYDEIEGIIDFQDEKKKQNLILKFDEFVLKYVSAIQMIWMLSTVKVPIVLMLEKESKFKNS